MTPEEFLLARIADLRRSFAGLPLGLWEKMNDCLEDQIRMIKFHADWPILVEGPMRIDEPLSADFNNSITYRMTQHMQWMTNAEYVKTFGTDPPTAPWFKTMLARYADHPDFDPSWIGETNAGS